MDLTKNEILQGNYLYPTRFINLIYTNHVISRLEERGLGLECIPTTVRVTVDNIYSGRADHQRRLTSMVIRLKYTQQKDLYLCLNPFDGALKTLWFKKAKK